MKHNFLKFGIAFLFTTQTAFATSAIDDYKMYFKQAQQMNSFVVWKHIKEKYSRPDQVLIEAWLLSLHHQDDLRNNSNQPKYDLKEYVSSADEKPIKITSQLGKKSTTLELKIDFDSATAKNAVDNSVFWSDQKSHLAQQLNALDVSYDQVIKLSHTKNSISNEQLKMISDQEYYVYLMQKRALLELSQKVLDLPKNEKSKKTSSFLFWSFLVPTAVANKSTSCLDQLGFISSLDSNTGQCKLKVEFSQHPLMAHLSCSSGAVCNPELYGLNRDGSGKALCLLESDIAAGKTCHSLSPLRSKDEAQKMFESMKSLMKGRSQKMDRQQAGGPRPEDRFIAEALALCENDPQQKSTTTCQELLQRKTYFNSTIVSAEGRTAPDQRNARRGKLSESDREAVVPPARASKAADESCGFFCKAGNWMTSDIGIKSLLTFGGAFVGYYFAKRKYKNSATAGTTSTSTTTLTTGTTNVYGLPVMPTAPDYNSGGVQ